MHAPLIALLAMMCAAHAERLFFLDLKDGRVLSANPDGSDLKVLLDGHKTGVDGIAVDSAARHIYWTNMGRVKVDDGSIERMNVDGTGLTTIVPRGGTFTPKQLKLDSKNRKLYWSDREGMRVMRSNLNGSNIEVLIETAQGDEARADARNWCVGIAVDVDRGKIYWTQKGGDNAGTGSIRRADIQNPKNIEVLFDGLPEPIDLDLDLTHRQIYWTDRGDPPKGNTVNRAPMDPKNRDDHEILVSGLKEAIGIALDVKGDRMFFTDLSGTVYTSKIDGSGKKVLLEGLGSLTGIVFE